MGGGAQAVVRGGQGTPGPHVVAGLEFGVYVLPKFVRS